MSDNRIFDQIFRSIQVLDGELQPGHDQGGWGWESQIHLLQLTHPNGPPAEVIHY